jgi:NAD(P)H-hydrate repair Nnr-like enzyme with NAD(P)H-hydrate dehydratase domain
MQPPFVRQTDKPVFPDIFWSRPTTKARAGRLLIVGGQRHEFSQVQAIFEMSQASGSGYVQAAMPDSLRPLLRDNAFGHLLPATSSGSLGRAATAELLQLAEDYDALIVGANLTNNSETGILIETLIREVERPIIITEETIGILKFHPDLITGNPKALVVTTMGGLFNLANYHHLPLAIRPNSGVLGKLEILHQLSAISKCSYFVFDGEIMVSADGQLGLTPLQQPLSRLPAAPTGVAGTFWVQERTRPFEALMTAAFVLAESVKSEEAPTTRTLAQQLPKILARYDQ